MTAGAIRTSATGAMAGVVWSLARHRWIIEATTRRAQASTHPEVSMAPDPRAEPAATGSAATGSVAAGSAATGSALSCRLRTWRVRALLTQEELASRAGLGVRTIRRLESDGLSRPHSQSLRRIADALELSKSERVQLTIAAQGGAAPSGRPRQLPAPPQMFTGRAAELADLDRVSDATAVVITAIDGMAGIGKTALAVHAAHRLADRYPDGQLFIDLHGYTKGVAPVTPGEALDRLLRALGMAGERIPADLDERAALFRSRLAERRMLILLDNAAAEAQVAPLLPGTAGSLVLVTSRRRLAGLDQTHTISLDTLPPPDAIALFIRTAGDDRRAHRPPELVAETVELCGRLPLAIRIAAARLRAHPVWTVAHLVERLRDGRHRLAELAAGERSVTTALELSYRQLTVEARRMYRLLGRHPGLEFDQYAAAALTGATLQAARRTLEELVDTHLLQEPVIDRFSFHDLVRAHATSAAARAQAGSGQPADLGRLLDYYRHTAAVAMDIAYPYERQRRPRVAPAVAPTPCLRDQAQAVAWLDAELSNLLVVARHAAGHGWPEHCLQVSATIDRHLRTRGRYRDAEGLHQLALAAARDTGHPAGELPARLGLGHVHRLQGQYQPAMVSFSQALGIARDTGDQIGEQQALTGLGLILQQQGRHEEALDRFTRALELARLAEDRIGEQEALIGISGPCWMQGRYDQTLRHLQRALQIARAIGNQIGEQDALTCLGWVHMGQRRFDRAVEDLEEALDLAHAANNRIGELNALTCLGWTRSRQGRDEHALADLTQVLEIARVTGHRPGQMDALLGLGHIHLRRGDLERAAGQFEQALATAREIRNPNWEFEALYGLGQVDRATGRLHTSLLRQRQALELATVLGQAPDQARAHDGLAQTYRVMNQQEPARRHWQRALDILVELGVEQVKDGHLCSTAIRHQLAGLDQ